MSITSFAYSLAQLPLNSAELGKASALLQEYNRVHPGDPAADEAGAVLAMKTSQLQKVQQAAQLQLRFEQFKQLFRSPEEIRAHYTGARDFIRHHRQAAAALPEYFFTAQLSKTKFLATLDVYDRILNNYDPRAWKIDAIAYAAIAATVTGGLSWFKGWEGFRAGALGAACAFAIHKSMPWISQQAIPWIVKQATALATGTGEAAPATTPVRKTPAPASALNTIASFSLTPQDAPLAKLHPNKQLAYDALTQGSPPSQPLRFAKVELASDAKALEQTPLLAPAIRLQKKAGLFAFPPSTEDTVHWTADFADPFLLGFIDGPLLAQEELLALEHPALYHLSEALCKERRLKDRQVALIQNVERYGALQGLYGNAFAAASSEKILQRLKRFEERAASNLFAMAAPRGEAGQPYSKQDLATLFLKAYTAYAGIKQASPDKQVFAHTGNWGAGAFGGSPLAAALAQILAARSAGVHLCYYPLEHRDSLNKALELLDALETNAPQLTASQILALFADNAAALGLVWKQGNGT